NHSPPRAKDATGRAGPVRAGRRWLGSRSPALAERRHDPDPGGAPLARPLGFNEGPDDRGLRLSQRYRTSIHSGISASPLSWYVPPTLSSRMYMNVDSIPRSSVPTRAVVFLRKHVFSVPTPRPVMSQPWVCHPYPVPPLQFGK